MDELRQCFSDYLDSRGKRLRYPLDIDSLVEHFLGIGFEYLPLQSMFPDIHVGKDDKFWGCLTWDVKTSKWIILLDESLAEPDKERPASFSIAHEVVHYVEDVPPAEKDGSQLMLPGSGTSGSRKPIYCRKSDQQDLIERRANYGAAYLLAPDEKVIQEFRLYRTMAKKDPDKLLDPEDKSDYLGIVYDLTYEFGISPTAMKIRLEEIGLFQAVGQKSLF
jgi:hypothetical protein